jgi:hypothetical protein
MNGGLLRETTLQYFIFIMLMQSEYAQLSTQLCRRRLLFFHR